MSSKTIDFANKNGYVETIYGRKLYLPEINSKQPQRRKYAERTAINAPVQGTAADIIKIGIIISIWFMIVVFFSILFYFF